MNETRDDEFHRYKELLLSEIKRLNESVIVLDSRIRDMQIEQTMQRTKNSTINGFISVVISVAVSFAVVYFQKSLE